MLQLFVLLGVIVFLLGCSEPELYMWLVKHKSPVDRSVSSFLTKPAEIIGYCAMIIVLLVMAGVIHNWISWLLIATAIGVFGAMFTDSFQSVADSNPWLKAHRERVHLSSAALAFVSALGWSVALSVYTGNKYLTILTAAYFFGSAGFYYKWPQFPARAEKYAIGVICAILAVFIHAYVR